MRHLIKNDFVVIPRPAPVLMKKLRDKITQEYSSC